MKHLSQFFAQLCRLSKDQRGSILIIFVLFMVAFFAVAGLALDSARVMMVNNDLQQLADAAALAAANKMDGTTSLTVADNAARSLSNTPSPHLWSTAGAEISSVTFYATLADANAQANPITSSGSPTNARFVRVNTGVWGIAPLLLQFAGTSKEADTRASAIAGWSTVACKVQPLMLCNPGEAMDPPEPFSAIAKKGELFAFSVSGNNSLGPGNFSLLKPPDLSGPTTAQDIEALLSRDAPNFCYVDTVTPATGQKTSVVSRGINARFDIQPQSANIPAGMDLTPGPNNLKGDDDNTCLTNSNYGANGKNVDLTHALPLNSNMTFTASDPVAGGSFDTTAAADYMAAHHGGAPWPNGMTRYEMYKAEIDNSGKTWDLNSSATTSPYALNHTAPGTAEKLVNTPNTCAGSKWPASTDPARRLVTVAVVNCKSQGLTGSSVKTLFSDEYAQFFLVRPVTNGSDSSSYPNYGGVIFAEFQKFLKVGDSNGPHHLVQLYQ